MSDTVNLYDGLPTLPTYDELTTHRQEQVELGYLFKLHATSLGRDEVIEAHVRRLNLTERAVIDALPQNIRATVWEGVKEFDRLRKRQAKNPEAIGDTLEATVTKNETSMKAADAFCVASFIRPKLVATEQEQALSGDPYTWWVGRVAAEDRARMFMANMDADSEAAQSLTLFRRAPRTDVPDVAPRPTAAASIFAVEPPGSGV